MKKTKHFQGVTLPQGALKTMLLMKLSFAIILAASLQVAAKTYSQETISVDFRNVKLEKALKEVEHKSSYRFVYSSLTFPRDVRITLRVADVPVNQVLDELLNNTGLRYRIMDNKLVVITKEENSQQVKTISGRVTNDRNEPLSGVTVQAKGSTKATSTAGDGSFSIEVEDGVTELVFSYVGMESQEVSIVGKTTLLVKLITTEKSLEDVVVIGYGAKTKTTVTGAVSVVNARQLANRPAANVASSLQGLVPGLQITRGNTGRVGSENDLGIQIRGLTTRSGSGVLIVVDGIVQPYENAFALNNIDPNDIESISVLKDAQAAIYGSRASNGVILVTTKSGRSQKPTVNITTNFNIVKPGIVRKQANILQAIEMWTESYENDGVVNNFYSHLKPFLTQNLDLNKITVAKGPFPDTKDITLSNNDWMDIMYGPALQQQHNASVSGRSGKSNYFFSLGVIDQNSMLRYGTNYNRKYNARLKYDFEVNAWLKLRANVALLSQKLVQPTDYDLIQDLTSQSYAGKAKYTQSGKYYGFGGYLSTIGWAEKGGNRITRSLQARTSFDIVLNPIKNLEITGQLAMNNDQSDETALRTGFLSYTYDDEIIFNSNLYWGGRDQVRAAYSKNMQTVANLLATYKYNLGDHHFEILGGAAHEEFENRNLNAFREGDPSALLNNNISNLNIGAPTRQFNSESKTQFALSSAFSRLSYNYGGRYYFEGNFRYDGSSKLSDKNRWKSFYGGSVGWIVTNESFMSKTSNFLDLLKLRLSYGQLGNQAANEISNFDYLQLLATGNEYPFGPVNTPARTGSIRVPRLSSPDRSWEIINIANAGIDVATLKNRFAISFDYFIRTNSNAFYRVEFPSILGIQAPLINGAKLRTNGWELSLRWNDKINKDFSYSVDVLVSNAINKAVKLADAARPAYGFNPFIEGIEQGTYYGFKFGGFIQDSKDSAAYVSSLPGKGFPSNIRVGDAKYLDLNGDGKLSTNVYDPNDPSKGGDVVAIGNANQRYFYTATLGAQWKGLFLTAIFQGVGKWQVFDGNVAAAPFFRNPQAYHYRNTWAPDRTSAEYPRMSQNDGINNYNYLISDAGYRLKNSRYVRLKNLQIGYNLPASLLKKVGIQTAQIYFSGTDLWESSKIPRGFDPERPFAIVVTPYPRSYSFGLNVSL
jgi:TonB-linked SusC/RagA family outer membrane protein